MESVLEGAVGDKEGNPGEPDNRENSPERIVVSSDLMASDD